MEILFEKFKNLKGYQKAAILFGAALVFFLMLHFGVGSGFDVND